MKEKNILCMVEIVDKEITEFVLEKKSNAREQIDTIVNTANPTLMGSEKNGVDKAIHTAINRELHGHTFSELIRKEIDSSFTESKKNGNSDVRPKNTIRCQRGKTVITSGYGFCSHVIHVVGPEYDGLPKNHGTAAKLISFASSSRIQMLADCYVEIIKTVMDNPEIKRIAIPVISSGNYGFPFKTAVKIALVSIGNTLTDFKNRDPELFNMAALEKIYLCIYHSDADIMWKNYRMAQKVWKKYEPVFKRNQKCVYQNSLTAHIQYFTEVIQYDRKKGYFTIALWFRLLLLGLRTLFLPITLIKDFVGRCSWQRRRGTVELITVVKVFCPIICFRFFQNADLSLKTVWGIKGFILYMMTDTLTYLLLLILLSDIQKRSANTIRSIICIFLNYIEVCFDLSVLFWIENHSSLKFNQAVEFICLGKEIGCTGTAFNTFLMYLNKGAKFFFMSLAFGYFSKHLRQRKFMS